MSLVCDRDRGIRETATVTGDGVLMGCPNTAQGYRELCAVYG